MQTEFDFVLPKGYIDEDNTLHREGSMRLATAMDELAPLRDPRVRANEGYLVVALLARVITRLGDIEDVTPAIVENMFAADISYLQDFYRRVNDVEGHYTTVVCPNCGEEFEEELPLLGES